MKKRLAVLVVVLFLIAGVVYESLKWGKKSVAPVSAAITAIPIGASFIFESNKTYPLWKGLSQNSLIWKDLLGTETVAELNGNMHYLDSLVSGEPKMRAMVEAQPIFISAHANGMQHFDYLFICALPGDAAAKTLQDYMQSVSAKGSLTSTQYDGITEYCLKIPGKSDFYYSVYDGIFIGSLKSEIVQESLRQQESPEKVSLMGMPLFVKALKATSNEAPAKLFIRYQFINDVLTSFTGKEANSLLSSVPDFAQWTAVEISTEMNEVMMNGFTVTDSTGMQYLELFSGQNPQTTGVPSVVPANTSFMACFELSDSKTFIKDYKRYLGLHRRMPKHNEWLAQVEKNYGINPEKNFYPWLDNEIALVITEPSDTTLQNDTYALIGTRDTKEAINTLGKMADTIFGDQEKHFETYKFMGHDIHYIGLDNMLPNLLGGAFEPMKRTYYTAIDKFIVFANSGEALQMFINRYESGATLEKDSYYQSFTRDHIENGAGVYIYNNVALSPMLYEQYLDKPYADAIKKHTDITRKFQAVEAQFTYMQGMFYTNVYFKRNPDYKKQAGALWQMALDTTLAAPPCWVTDYKTKYQYVMAEDKADNIYLISNTGHIQWEKQVDGKIMGPVQQLDGLKNGKLQYLFTTERNIYIVDRNGKDVYGYPVSIPSKATANASLFDYDGKRNYRIAVPCGDGKIRMYDNTGKSIKDWKPEETDGLVKCPLQYMNIDDEGFIIAVDDKGKVYTYDRKGKSKLDFTKRLPANISSFYITKAKTLKETYLMACDSTGVVYQLSLTDFLNRTQYLPEGIHRPAFAPVDLEGKGQTDMVFFVKYDVYAYSPDKKQIFHYTMHDSLRNNIMSYTFPDGKTRIGGVATKPGKIYMLDEKGDMCPGFPLQGSYPFSIGDMNNDGQLYLLTAIGNSVYVYSLP